MAGTTPNLALYLPGGGSTGTYTPDEVADIDPLNQNFVKLDTFAGQVGVQANQSKQFYGPAAAIASVSGMKLGDTYQESDGSLLKKMYDGLQWVQVLYFATGPSAQTDYGTTELQICTLTVPMILGRKYKISGQISGSQVTATGTLNSRIRVGATVGTGNSGQDYHRPITGLNLTIGTAGAGFASGIWTAVASGDTVIALTAISTAFGFRMSPGQGCLVVEPVY